MRNQRYSADTRFGRIVDGVTGQITKLLQGKKVSPDVFIDSELVATVEIQEAVIKVIFIGSDNPAEPPFEYLIPRSWSWQDAVRMALAARFPSLMESEERKAAHGLIQYARAIVDFSITDAAVA